MAQTYLVLVFVFYYFVGTYQLPSRNIAVYGGDDVTIQEVPYMVNIKDSLENLVCGGSIIHKKFILTAAHCFEPSKTYSVYVGSEELNEGLRFEISKIHIHENYTLSSGNDNIALIQLAEPLIYGKKVARVKLSNGDEELEEGTLVTIAGWGETESSMESNYLLKAEIPIDDIEDCRRVYTHMDIDDQKQFCAGDTGKSPCWDDDGGPVTLNGVQIGIVLKTEYVYCDEDPKLFLKVSTHSRWIEQIINKNL